MGSDLTPLEYTFSAWAFLAPALASCIVVTLVLTALALITALRRRGFARTRLVQEIQRGSILSLVFGVLGWTIGYFTGASRVGVVGDLLPAVLGLFGAVAGYVTLRYGQTLVASMMVLSLSLALFLGATQGARIRADHEALDIMMPSLDDLQREARKERNIREYRKALGLEWPPAHQPSWAKPKAEK